MECNIMYLTYYIPILIKACNLNIKEGRWKKNSAADRRIVRITVGKADWENSKHKNNRHGLSWQAAYRIMWFGLVQQMDINRI